jgi:hypothetical protein
VAADFGCQSRTRPRAGAAALRGVPSPPAAFRRGGLAPVPVYPYRAALFLNPFPAAGASNAGASASLARRPRGAGIVMDTPYPGARELR